jgi:hypothetical protein
MLYATFPKNMTVCSSCGAYTNAEVARHLYLNGPSCLFL